MKLSTAVMAHPSREAYVTELLPKLGLAGDAVVWDRINNRWDTGRRAMLAFDPACTHHLVVQDDAVVPRDLLAGVSEALGHIPADSPVSLYAGNTRKFWNAAERVGVRPPTKTVWVTMGQIHWGVGIVMPVDMIEPMVTWCDQLTHVGNYDKRMSRWCEHKGLTVYYPWPSLLDHRKGPSLMPERWSQNRRAQRFIGGRTSAAGLTWDRPIVHIPPFRATPPVRHDPFTPGRRRIIR